MAVNSFDIGSVLPGLGEALGTGIGTGLQQRMQFNQQARGLQALLGFDAQKAQALSGLPPQYLEKLLPQVLQSNLRQQQAKTAAPGLLKFLPQGTTLEEAESLLNTDSKALSKLLSTLMGQAQETPIAGILEEFEVGNQPFQEIAQGQVQQQAPGQQLGNKPQAQPQIASTPGNKAAQLEQRLNQYLRDNPNISPIQKQQVREQFNKKIDKLRETQEKTNKKFEPFQDELMKKGAAGRENLARLDEMENLIRKGDIIPAIGGSLLETVSNGLFGFGIDLFGLTSADTQKFRKLQKDFVKNAKDIFGARVTEGEIRLLLETFPSLTQSDEGKLAILETLKPMAYAQDAMYEAANDIAEQYDYNLPRNYERLVRQEAERRRDIYAKELKLNMEKIRQQYKQDFSKPGLKQRLRSKNQDLFKSRRAR